MKPPVGKAILGGLVGTILITLMMYPVARMMMGSSMDVAAMLGSKLGGSWWAGMILHFVDGTIIFPLIYVFVLYAFLPGAPWAKGLIWGLVLWLLSRVVVMPMMGQPMFSPMMAVVGSLVGHAIYGIALGAIAGGSRATPAPATASH